MASLRLRPLYPQEKTLHLLYRRTYGLQGLSGRFLEEEKYLYVPVVEPRIIQLLSVTVSFCGCFNADLANVFGENSDRRRAVLVRACVCVCVCTAVPLVVVWVGSCAEMNSWTCVFVASTWL